MDDRPIIPLQLTPARRLGELYRTVENRPLLTRAELNAFYEPSINDARGDDTTFDLQQSLRRHHRATPYRRFFFGSRGSGKSTELSRMMEGLEDRFRGVRVVVPNELNPALFEPHELVLAIALSLSREMAKVVEEEESERDLEGETLYAIQEWFVQAEYTDTRVLEKNAEGKVEAKPDLGFLQRFLPFTVSASGGVKATTSVKAEIKEKRRRLYGDLLAAVNRLISQCNELLGAIYGDDKEWVVLIEDFDKGTPMSVLKNLVYEHGFIFRDLEVHLICGLPTGLRFEARGNDLPLECCPMHDTPVYRQDYSPHEEGRQSLRDALARRLDASLFESDDQILRLIVASGGNLRTLFEMVVLAADRAAARRTRARSEDVEAGPIVADDVDRAINRQRSEFQYALVEDASGKGKRERLGQIYRQEPGHALSGDVLNDLLIGRLVQFFNGRGRYAVHPLVVDLLKDDPVFNPKEEELRGGLLD